MVWYAGGGGSAWQYAVTSRVSDFQMASKVFIEETDKNFKFITELYCSDFLDLGILRSLFVIGI